MPQESAKVAYVCSMKITQDVRDYAREHGLDTEEALAAGMEEQAEAFRESGGEIYRPA